jgi:hypothetical protein
VALKGIFPTYNFLLKSIVRAALSIVELGMCDAPLQVRPEMELRVKFGAGGTLAHHPNQV